MKKKEEPVAIEDLVIKEFNVVDEKNDKPGDKLLDYDCCGTLASSGDIC